MKTRMMSVISLAVICVPVLTASAREGNGSLAPRLKGMGKHRHSVTTESKEARKFFNQGLVLAFGFNHAEAARAFREAARLDPNCAMAYWGLAYVLGPNINAPMNPDHNKEAYEAIQKAVSLKDKASENERAYIDALAKRYVEKAPKDRKPLDLAYADAMREAAKNYPDDLDAQILLAEALMDTTPWDYWEKNGDPKPVTKEILAALESVLERKPKHPQALHLYIHAVEAVHPEKGEAVADKLVDLVPGAGHLVHMPGHIFIRLGRYEDTIEVNQDAMKADQSYITQCRQQGIYPLAYMPHNEHFVCAASALDGRSKLAVEASKSISGGAVSSDMMCHPSFGVLQHYHVAPMFTYVRFGMWDEMLKHPKPDEKYPYPIAIWHYGRGITFARTGELGKAREELANVKKTAADPKSKDVTIWGINSAGQILEIAANVLEGEIAASEKKYDAAINHLKKAAELEDSLQYSEPADWPHPVRQILGAVLLEAGKAEEAEKAYREDLHRYPENGWSLFGLQRSLEAQGKKDEANEAGREFKRAWKRADVQLTASRF